MIDEFIKNSKENKQLQIEKLIELAKEHSMPPEAIEAFKKRCAERQKVFQKWEDSQKITNEWLNLVYTI